MISGVPSGKFSALLVITILLIFWNVPLFGEDLSGKLIRIDHVVYNIDGNTRVNALVKDLNWEYGRVFSSVYQLDSYLQKQRQTLINKKVFQTVLTSYHIIKSEELIMDVEVTVTLEDSWTFLPIPVYTFDDNLGLVMGLGLDYKNVAGTLTNFKLTSYYSDLKSEIIADWTKLRAGSLFLDLRFNQLWETIKTADSNGNVDLEYSYIQTEFRISINFPIIPSLQYSARPILRWPYAYNFIYNSTDFENSQFTLTGTVPAYNHFLQWDSVNWIGSLRQGINASIENQIEYDYQKGRFVSWVDSKFKTYLYTPVISYNARISSFYYYNDFKRNAGDRLRGILDYKLDGDRGLYLNQSFPFNAVSIEKIGDLQISPFIDMGFVKRRNEQLVKNDIQYTAGIAIILFPAILSSFSLTMDAGINLREPGETEIGINSLLYF
ncbi:hypothetical protein [Oceanispirochaeta sp.]|jgi:hypothetical protein|uniref:hypothetical protein n=1 Tax=Oceanispirochaeta sp. TaxID=2035350 RepID=UPI002620CD19|nr:hypothetical protein [Oceanispirochaeta sp.]MDA3956361.1 hypothetical protein [Oceanispirochaeta sp.]